MLAAAPRKDLNRVKRKRTQSTSALSSSRKKKSTTSSIVDSSATSTADVSTTAFDFNSIDYESLVASLTDNAMTELPPDPIPPVAVASNKNNYSTDCKAATQVHYYTYEVSPHQVIPSQLASSTSIQPQSGTTTLLQDPSNYYNQPLQTKTARQPEWEPRLLLRQLYKVANQADAVVGIESTSNYNASMYLVNTQSSISFTMEDLLSLQSSRVVNALDKFFNGVTTGFPLLYFETILIEPIPTNNAAEGNTTAVAIYNYVLRPQPARQRSMYSDCDRASGRALPDVSRQTPALMLHSTGWNAFKRLFDCIESYYHICIASSPTIRLLIERYCKYFVKHYKATVMLSSRNINSGNPSSLRLPSGAYQHINTDLPLLLRELSERRIPHNHGDSDIGISGGYHQLNSNTLLQRALMPWMDSEVRRYCAPNICVAVIQELKFDLIRL